MNTSLDWNRKSVSPLSKDRVRLTTDETPRLGIRPNRIKLPELDGVMP